MHDPGRLLTAMVTPFDGDLALDEARAQELARRLVREGSQGLILSGTTGESPTLSRDEKLRLFSCVRAAIAPGEASLFAGTGSYDTKEAVALSVAAEGRGMDGLLVISPYYNKPNQEGLYRHFRAVAEAVSIPVLLYNHPGRTGVTIAPETMERLAALPNVLGVKDSSGSLELVTEYRRRTPPSFLVYSGDDPLTLPYLAVGGHGVVSVTSHVAGPELRKMIDAFFAGRLDEARRLHERLFDLNKVLFCAPSPAPTKAALAMRGFGVGGVRLPLVELDDEERRKVSSVLERLGAVGV